MWRAYTSVGTVSSSALLGSLVDLDVLNDQVAGIEALSIRVRLCVLEETEQELSRLDWPSSSGDTECLACDIPSILVSIPLTSSDQRYRTLCSTSSSSSVSPHRNGLLVFLDILQKLNGALQLPAVDSLTTILLDSSRKRIPGGTNAVSLVFLKLTRR